MQNETTRHKGKQEVRQTGRQYRRQDLGKADIPSNTKADTLRKPTPTVHCLKKCKIRPPRHKGKQEERQVGRQVGRQAGRQEGNKLGDKLGDKGEKTSGRRTHHPTQGNKKGDKGRQGGDKTSRKWTHHQHRSHVGTRPREGGHNIQHRHTCGETMGYKAS